MNPDRTKPRRAALARAWPRTRQAVAAFALAVLATGPGSLRAAPSTPGVITAEVVTRLHALDFAWLDARADALRASRARTDDGRWQLSLLFGALEDELPHAIVDEGRRAALARATRAYAAAHPRSANAGLFVEELLVADAWAARGHGWDEAVPPEAKRRFLDRLAEARDVLDGGRAAMAANPEWYADRATVALLEGAPTAAVDAFVQAGLAVEPRYHRLWYIGLQARTPARGGSLHAMADYIGRSAPAGPVRAGFDAEGLAARLAWAGENDAPGLLDDPDIDWPRVRRAIETMVATWPSQHNVQVGFLMACRRTDRDEAARLRPRVREPLRRDAVDSTQEPAFRRCMAWAAGATAEFTWRDPGAGTRVLVR